jgi:O-antigen ligase
MTAPQTQAATVQPSEEKSQWNFRLLLVCFVAVSVSLPMAWISLAKISLFVVGLVHLIAQNSKTPKTSTWTEGWTSKVVLLIVIAFFASLFWTEINLEIALLAAVKHAKLLEIPLLMLFIRTAVEARTAIVAFIAGQSFLLLSSWLIAAGLPIPWTTDPTGDYVVFSTYLDQSVMFACTAGLVWHLRQAKLCKPWLCVVLAAAALVNVFLLLGGRTGYLVAVAVLTLAITLTVPKRLQLATLIAAPLLVLCSLYWASGQVEDRLSKIVQESKSFSSKPETDSSSGWRINAWLRSVEAIDEKPLQGHGVGSWALTAKRLQGDNGVKVFGAGNASNPHQEFLLWGVELGVWGTALLLLLMASIVKDARRFSPPVQRAVFSVVAALAVACLFNSALYDDLMGDYFCVALGLLMALGANERLTATSQHLDIR